jgi:hypothetical protein
MIHQPQSHRLHGPKNIAILQFMELFSMKFFSLFLVTSCSTDPLLLRSSLYFNQLSLFSCNMSHCHRNRNFHNTTTPWKRVLFEKPKSPQPAKHLLAFHGTRRFSTAFTRARPVSLTSARLILSTRPTPLLEDPF